MSTNLSGVNAIRRSLLVTLTLLLSSCGPTANISPEFVGAKDALYAFLPVEVEEDLRDARVKFLRQSFDVELEGRGLHLLDDRIVQRICSSPECPESKKLVDTYRLAGVVRLRVDSLSRYNFGIGVYSTLAGNLVIEDSQGSEVASIEHRESERSGILFDSGQVVSAISDQFINPGDETFNRLALRFAKSVSAEVPRLADSESLRAYDVSITKVDTWPVQPLVYRVCVEGSPKGLADLVIGSRRTNLRELSPGLYCGVYRIPTGLEVAQVELSSPFGAQSRQFVPLRTKDLCNLSFYSLVLTDGDKVKIKFVCSVEERKSCEELEDSCGSSSFHIYQSKNLVGPFKKVAALTKGHEWSSRDPEMESFYHAVAVNSEGASSGPITFGAYK